MKKTVFAFLCLAMSWQVSAQFSPKIDPSIQEQLIKNPTQPIEVLVVLNRQAPFEELVDNVKSAGARRADAQRAGLKKLRAVAQSSQPNVIAQIVRETDIRENEILSFWMLNALGIETTRDAIISIAEIAAVDFIIEPPRYEEAVVERTNVSALAEPNGHELGHDVINAPALWKMGYSGYGTKAYIYDTGVDIDHPALRANFSYHNNPLDQSWNGLEEEPYTCSDHGSHVAGTILGLDRINNDTIGVAFNAQYMMTPNFTTCGVRRLNNMIVWQWVFDPDDDPETIEEIPDAMNMSGGSFVNGNVCGDFLVQSLLSGFQLTNMGNIFAGGNEGPNDTSHRAPAVHNLDLVHAFAVGNLNANTNEIAESSSRGPSICVSNDSSIYIKPEVSAPGTFVRSSIVGGFYANFTGTSMAAPHTTGAYLLLKEAYPTLSEEEILLSLYFSAQDYGVPGEDNVYGMGVIDVLAAFNYLQDQGNTPVPPLSRTYDLVTIDLEMNETVFCSGQPSATLRFENGGEQPITDVMIHVSEGNGFMESFDMPYSGLLMPDEMAEVEIVLPANLMVGKHELLVSLELMDNDEEVRTLNNQFKTIYRVFEDIPFEVDALVSPTGDICPGSRVLLSTTTPVEENQILRWFENSTFGNPVFIGDQYLTPPLYDGMLYFIEQTSEFTVGEGIDENNHDFDSGANGGLLFNVERPCTLETVTVDAGASGGGRSIELYDGFGELLRSKLVILSPGLNIIDLGWRFDNEGKGYSIVQNIGQSFGHTKFGAEFPYVQNDLIRINSGLINGFEDNNSYYYFYDWKVTADHPCGAKFIDVFVNNNDTIPEIAIVAADTVFLSDGGLLTLTTDQPDGFSQFDWTLPNAEMMSGTEVATTFLAAGEYHISVQATRDDDCTTNAVKDVVVINDVNVSIKTEKNVAFKVYPNPTDDVLFIKFENNESRNAEANITIMDMLGRSVIVEQAMLVNDVISMNVQQLNAGIYLLKVDGFSRLVVIE